MLSQNTDSHKRWSGFFFFTSLVSSGSVWSTVSERSFCRYFSAFSGSDWAFSSNLVSANTQMVNITQCWCNCNSETPGGDIHHIQMSPPCLGWKIPRPWFDFLWPYYIMSCSETSYHHIKTSLPWFAVFHSLPTVPLSENVPKQMILCFWSAPFFQLRSDIYTVRQKNPQTFKFMATFYEDRDVVSAATHLYFLMRYLQWRSRYSLEGRHSLRDQKSSKRILGEQDFPGFPPNR